MKVPVKITLVLSAPYPIALRALPEYPGRKLGIHFESGDSLTVFSQFRKCHYVHSDGVRYEIRFYELIDGLGWIHDFDVKMPQQRTVIFGSDSHFDDDTNVLISNISHDPAYVFPFPEFPSSHLQVALDPGESAIVSSEFRKVFYIHSDLVRYCIRFYRLLDNSGWIHDFNPNHPLQRNLFCELLELSLCVLRSLALQCGLVEVSFDRRYQMISFKSDQHRYNIYYKTGTVVIILGFPRQKHRYRIMQKQSLDDIRSLFLDPEGCRFSHTFDEDCDEESALRNQIGRLREEQANIEKEISELTRSVELYDKILAGERKRRNVSTSPIRFLTKNSQSNGDRGGNIRCNLSDEQAEFVTQNWSSQVSTIALGGEGIIFLYDDMSWSSTNGLPPLIHRVLSIRPIHLPPPTYVSCGSMNRCYILFEDGSSEWNGSENFSKCVRNRKIKRVAFGRQWNSFVVVFENGDIEFENIPSDLEMHIRRKEHNDIAEIYLGPSGEWFLSRSGGSISWMAKSCESNTRDLQMKITDILFGAFGTYIIRYNN